MPELCLHGLDGMVPGNRLACHRVPPKGVVIQRSKAKHALHFAGWPLVAIDVAREGPASLFFRVTSWLSWPIGTMLRAHVRS